MAPNSSNSDKKQHAYQPSSSKLGCYATTATNKSRPSTGKVVAFGSVVENKPLSKPMRTVQMPQYKPKPSITTSVMAKPPIKKPLFK